ncbi:antibiotic biosynthesis monooxygenase family protein [Nocardioides zeae]|uniref:Antibiotic biosynthesis monooxygenase family protein n=1 Tax=Nocardioides imazamoxiresistens TaxID=3231893 RepID=A0ABU3PRQ2_9ACTN|nr:antibiotic biosynthesis monooxygenase family protein [Nocardioides zeae]MDT9591892.1 antibiotic biosynthesis monooxygenase family protein [Nocardioides zeae]
METPEHAPSEIVVTGHLAVAPAERDRYLAGCAEVVRLARAAPGCRDFALGADLVDPGRVNVLERWASRAELAAFRGSGPSDDQQAALLAVDVVELEVPRSEAR